MEIRNATPKDTHDLLAIYAPIVERTSISFETKVPTVAEFAQRIQDIQKNFPWFVMESEGKLMGYAYASSFNVRAAYQWSANTAVYVDSASQGKGIGQALYFELFEALKKQGVHNVFAGITMSNVGSIRFHERWGFERVALYKNAGYKFGAWEDVGWWQMPLRPCTGEPETFIPFRN